MERDAMAAAGRSLPSRDREDADLRDNQRLELIRRAHPPSVLRASLAGVGVLLVVSTIAETVRHIAPRSTFRDVVADVLSVDTETSFAAAFSTLLLIACGGASWTIGRVGLRTGLPFHREWMLAGVLLLVLSVEEYVGLHNLLADGLGEMIKDPGSVLHHLWVVPPTIAGALMVAAYGRFVRTLPSATRRLCAAAAAMYLVGGVGVDAIGHSVLADDQPGTAYVALFTIEEALEMVAASLILYAVLTFGRDHLDAH